MSIESLVSKPRENHKTVSIPKIDEYQSEVEVSQYIRPNSSALPEIASCASLSSFVQACCVVTRHRPSVKCRVPTFPEPPIVRRLATGAPLGRFQRLCHQKAVESMVLQHNSDPLRAARFGADKASMLAMPFPR
jgi:hypothetical protein